jgi:hypothetical protein
MFWFSDNGFQKKGKVGRVFIFCFYFQSNMGRVFIFCFYFQRFKNWDFFLLLYRKKNRRRTVFLKKKKFKFTAKIKFSSVLVTPTTFDKRLND